MSEIVIGGGGRELAEALIEIERRLDAERPDAVVIRGCDDEALAATLVAAKLLVPARIEEPEPEPKDATQEGNRRLIRLLAAAKSPPTLGP